DPGHAGARVVRHEARRPRDRGSRDELVQSDSHAHLRERGPGRRGAGDAEPGSVEPELVLDGPVLTDEGSVRVEPTEPDRGEAGRVHARGDGDPGDDGDGLLLPAGAGKDDG